MAASSSSLPELGEQLAPSRTVATASQGKAMQDTQAVSIVDSWVDVGDKRAGDSSDGNAEKKHCVPPLGSIPAATDKISCLPPLPTNLSPSAVWDDVCQMAKCLAEATPNSDPLLDSHVLSQEEFYRQRLTRITNLLGTYRMELQMLHGTLREKKSALRRAVRSGLSSAKIGGSAYRGWISSSVQGGGQAVEGPGAGRSCAGLKGESVCGAACLPLASFCPDCILDDTAQHLYQPHPATGRPAPRQPSAADMRKNAAELRQRAQLAAAAASEGPGGGKGGQLWIETGGRKDVLGSPGMQAMSKISTPDKEIANSLIAASVADKAPKREPPRQAPAKPAAAGGAGASAGEAAPQDGLSAAGKAAGGAAATQHAACVPAQSASGAAEGKVAAEGKQDVGEDGGEKTAGRQPAGEGSDSKRGEEGAEHPESKDAGGEESTAVEDEEGGDGQDDTSLDGLVGLMTEIQRKRAELPAADPEASADGV